MNDSETFLAKAKFVNATQFPVYDVTVRTQGERIFGDYKTLVGVLPPTTEPLHLDYLSRIVTEQVTKTLSIEFGNDLYRKVEPDPYGYDEGDKPELSQEAQTRALEIVRQHIQVTVSFRLGNQQWTRLPNGHLKAVVVV